VFVAQYFTNPNITLESLSFDIMLTSMMIAGTVGEADSEGFLINGRMPPIDVPRNQTEYMLTIATDMSSQDYIENTNITFDLFSNLRTSDGISANSSVSAILFLTGELNFS